jgi:hypothetical protein
MVVFKNEVGGLAGLIIIFWSLESSPCLCLAVRGQARQACLLPIAEFSSALGESDLTHSIFSPILCALSGVVLPKQ